MTQPLEYQSALPVRRPPLWFHHVISVILSGAVWVIVSISAMFVIPRFEAIFKDFKAELPIVTKCLLMFSRWCGNDHGWLWLFVMLGGLVGLGFVLDATAPEPRLPRRYCYLLWILLLVLLAVYVVTAFAGIFVPMFTLTDSLNSKVR